MRLWDSRKICKPETLGEKMDEFLNPNLNPERMNPEGLNQNGQTPSPIKRKTRSPFRDSKLLNFGLKAFLGVVVVLGFLTAVQCSIKKPESPTWTTQFAVPMVNRTYPMDDIIDHIDQPNIYYDSTGDTNMVLFRYEQDVDTVTVTDNLSTSGIAHTGGDGLGQITINPASPDPITIDLNTYVPLTLGVAIPASSFDIVEDIDPIGTFSSATIASGSFDFILTNDFGVDLDTVIFKLVDRFDNDTVSCDTIPSPGLAAGDVDTVSLDLSGQTISDDLRMVIHCHTPGDPNPVLSVSNKNLSTEGSSDSLVVSSATTQVPQMTKTFNELVELTENNTIYSAELSSGSLDIQIQNTTEVESDFAITLNDFQLNGNPLVITRTVDSNSTVNINIDLSNYIFAPADSTAPQELSIDVVADIDSTAPDLRTVSENDSLLITANMTDLAFSSMTGIIQPTNADFSAIQLDIDIPEGFDSLQLVGARMNLEIENGINFPGALALTVTGDNGEVLNLSGPITAGSSTVPVTSTISENDITSFLYPMPGSITVNGTATFGDGSTVGTVTPDDYVFSHVEIVSPLSLIVADSTKVNADIQSEEIDQEDIELVTDHIVEARFSTIITNHLPLGISVELFLDGDSLNLNANDAQLVVGPITVNAGQVDAGGFVTQATESINNLVLDSLEIKILENDTLYIGQNIILEGTGGSSVTISPDDYYQIVGAIEADYLFDGEF